MSMLCSENSDHLNIAQQRDLVDMAGFYIADLLLNIDCELSVENFVCSFIDGTNVDGESPALCLCQAESICVDGQLLCHSFELNVVRETVWV